MKAVIAYTLVVIGIPYFAGLLFGRILTLPTSMIVGLLRNVGLLSGSDAATVAQDIEGGFAWSQRGNINISMPDRIVHVLMDLYNGFGAAFASGVIFHLFGLSLTVAVPLVLTVWEILFSVAWRQSFRVLFGSLAGIVLGWFVVLRVFTI